MSQLDDIATGARVAFLQTILDFQNRTLSGDNVAGAFETEVDRQHARIARKLSDLAAQGTDVAAAADDLSGLVISVKAQGPSVEGLI